MRCQAVLSIWVIAPTAPMTPGVVGHAVHAAEALDRSVDELLDLILLGDIGVHVHCRVAEFCRKCRAAFVLHVRHDDARRYQGLSGP